MPVVEKRSGVQSFVFFGRNPERKPAWRFKPYISPTQGEGVHGLGLLKTTALKMVAKAPVLQPGVSLQYQLLIELSYLDLSQIKYMLI